MVVFCYVVALCACTIGSICGMGGGVIIKPVLDALGIFSVPTINFLSGCTVLCMSAYSVAKVLIKKKSVIDLKKSSFLAISAAVGGLTGKMLFVSVSGLFVNQNIAGGIQAIVLLILTFLTFLYSLNKQKFSSKQLENPMSCLFVGFVLGNLGAFLGIGGGPFNIAVLYYYFSMSTKKAAQNSLYIIFFSQLASLIRTAASSSIPEVSIWVLIGMVLCGIAGSEIGSKINDRISEKTASYLFNVSMVLVMLINIFNAFHFFYN